MFLVRVDECVSPNSSELVSQLMGLLFLVVWSNVSVMEGFHGKIYPPAEHWNITLEWNNTEINSGHVRTSQTALHFSSPGSFTLWFGMSLVGRMSWWDSWGSSPLEPAVLTLTYASVLGRGSPLSGSVRRAVEWCVVNLAKEAMVTLTMLLKCLWLHHLPTVAAHYQEEVIMCWAVAIYRHVCEDK